MIVIGADPGMTGAICLLDTKVSDRVLLWDIPTLEVHVRGAAKPRKTINHHELRDLVKEITSAFKIDHAVLERVRGMGRDGGASAFRFGHTTGSIAQALVGGGIDFDEVTPQVWKKHFGLLKKTKRDSCELAQTFFPKNYDQFTRVTKDDGKAEAALIARYCAHKHGALFNDAA